MYVNVLSKMHFDYYRYSRGRLEGKRLQRHYSDESLPGGGASLFTSPAHYRIHSSADEISSVNRSPSLSSSDESFSRTTDASHSPPRDNAKDWVYPAGIQVLLSQRTDGLHNDLDY